MNLPLEQCGYPIDNAINHGSRHAVDDDRTAIVNIFAPTPRTKPSACGQVGPISLQKIFTLNRWYSIINHNLTH